MKVLKVLLLVSMVLGAVGCQSKDASTDQVGSTPSGSSFLASSEPTGAMPVGEAREKTEDGQEVTLVGRIGGSSKPFVEGLAAFTIVDPKVPFCAPGEGCPTPWDYCCETDAVRGNIATVKIVNEKGSPVGKSARDLLNVKELATVVVKGKAKRDDQGNLTVSANQVFVRSGE
ncbi:MAG: hypothetical protein B7Z55_01710 [Planctomycetales bacterium 12-60-4]|nr:MAG: hypothetical protein B7Z55_01710 [Planctomycetales bacterium 12-60-4]